MGGIDIAHRHRFDEICRRLESVMDELASFRGDNRFDSVFSADSPNARQQKVLADMDERGAISNGHHPFFGVDIKEYKRDDLRRDKHHVVHTSSSLHGCRCVPRPASDFRKSWIEKYLRLRKFRSDIFSDGIFHDASWDIILDLYVNHDRHISISSACIASGSPSTTALRHIKDLEMRGYLFRHPDPTDNRRCFVNLSPDAVRKVERWVDRWIEQLWPCTPKHIDPDDNGSSVRHADSIG